MDLLQTFRKFDVQKEQAVKSEVPRALEIQKRKFLCAIGKAEPNTMNENDEKFVTECNQNLNPLGPFTGLHLEPSKSLHWSDTIALRNVKELLEKHQNFDIDLYLDCAKAIFLTYSGKQIVSGFYEAFTYVLTHARLFGDQTKNMFQVKSNGSKCKINLGAVSEPLSGSVYMEKVTILIEGLKTEYNEDKYMILNGNVTYLTLLILRRYTRNSLHFSEAFDRGNIHHDYVKLCPHPLNDKLPRIDKHFNRHLPENRLQTPLYLAIHALMTVRDFRSRLILRKTCIHYMEWTGLQLPNLFFKVVKLYKIEEAKLWDDLCFDTTFPSLFKLADSYYKQYEMSKANPPEHSLWFRYCRVLNKAYHKDLSAQENLHICMILAYLIDLKVGFTESRFRVSYWARACEFKEAALETAQVLYDMYNE